jgi:hypothetical protein|tara:strand:- start:27349 stop:27774 length:426 start_codon:yes stop_codon:yes gene_type:complete
MTKRVRLAFEEEYSEFLGREWGGQRGGGCFRLLYDVGIALGIHECKEDYSFNHRAFLRDLWEDEGWEVFRESEMGEQFDLGDLKKWDVLLMNLGSNRLNHGALYLGDGYILHHKAFDISRVEKVQTYIASTMYVIRKRDVS